MKGIALQQGEIIAKYIEKNLKSSSPEPACQFQSYLE
jgi:NADH dehydrogenase FAD-containing subunit